MTTLVVPSRFNGPPQSGNGGWTCGALADALTAPPGQCVQVRLSAPPPLDVELALTAQDGDVVASAGEVVVARARVVPSPFTGPAPEPVSWAAALAAEPGYRGRGDHPFPTCFTCGPERTSSDGLRLSPGPLPDRPELTACTWTPDPSVAQEGLVPPAVTWAALDCPGGWSIDLVGRPMVLGTMTARVDERPTVGARHVVMGRLVGQEGRKAWTETALYALDPVPRLLARAAALWIAVDPAGVRPR